MIERDFDAKYESLNLAHYLGLWPLPLQWQSRKAWLSLIILLGLLFEAANGFLFFIGYYILWQDWWSSYYLVNGRMYPLYIKDDD